MTSGTENSSDVATMVVVRSGRLFATNDPWDPFQLIDPDGNPLEAVRAFFADLQASGRSPATLRSYGMDLLRWFRFLWSLEVPWERAARAEARDFSRWMQLATKPVRPHWRHPGELAETPALAPANRYAPSVRAHSETVLRGFYDFTEKRARDRS